MEQLVNYSPSAGSLNLEQWKLYDIVIESYIQDIRGFRPLCLIWAR